MAEFDKDKLARINELASKSKNGDLTPEEETERESLRKEYIDNFRNMFKSQIEMLQVYDKEGKEVTPDKVKKIQKEKGLRDE